MRIIKLNKLLMLTAFFIDNRKTVETVSEQEYLQVLVGINPDENLIKTTKVTVLTVYSIESPR